MRKFMISGVSVVAASILLLAALPQGPGAIKYGDRCRAWIGKPFYVLPEIMGAVQAEKGSFRLVSVGTDFLEFESEKERVLMPLSAVRLTIEK